MRGIRTTRLIATLTGAAVLAAACGSDADDADTADDPPAASEPAPEAEPEPEPEPDPEPALEPEPELEPELEPDLEPEPEPEPSPDPFAEISATVASFIDDNGLNGAGVAIVDADDGVVYEEYWGEIAPDRASFIASSTKQIVAGVMLRLQEEGVLDVDAPLADVVGDAWGPDVEPITVAQMVSNSSGLVGLGPNPLYQPYLCQFLADQELESCGATIASTPDDDGDIVAPDTEYRYGGGQWQVAGAVAEFVSGETIDDLLQRIYVEPCGLSENFGINNHWGTLGGGGSGYPTDFDGDLSLLTPTENPHMEGGIYATVPDYAELLLLHLRGGECPNGSVLSPESLAVMHADRSAEWGGDAGDADTGYGFGWWHDRETGRINDPGAYGSFPWLDLDDGYGAFVLIEADSNTGNRLAAEIEELVHTAMTT